MKYVLKTIYCVGALSLFIFGTYGINSASAQETCRFSTTANGSTGPACPTGSPTWMECALRSAGSVRGSDGVNHTCMDSAYDDCMGDYFDIQTDCDDGACDANYRIIRGVFTCFDN